MKCEPAIRSSNLLHIVKAKITIGAINLSVEVECDDPELTVKAKKLIETNEEAIEAAMAQAVVGHLERLLPGIKCSCTGGKWDGEDV